MTDQDEAGAADAGAQDIRSAVAAALNEREDAQPAARDDLADKLVTETPLACYTAALFARSSLRWHVDARRRLAAYYPSLCLSRV